MIPKGRMIRLMRITNAVVEMASLELEEGEYAAEYREANEEEKAFILKGIADAFGDSIHD